MNNWTDSIAVLTTLAQFRVEFDQWMHDQGDTARFKGTLKKTVGRNLP
jgi:hypothetical protein